MRVIDLDTGETIQAANDDDLAQLVIRHYEERGKAIDEETARGLVSDRAYDALDS